MRISQIIDDEIDQNEIESNYLWIDKEKEIKRINLSSLTVDFSLSFESGDSFIPVMAIPNNKVYWIEFQSYDKCFESQCITDENFNKKIIQKTLTDKLDYISRIACYYDESIFIWEETVDLTQKKYYSAKRYLISQDQWYTLCTLPFADPHLCVGFNQKIIWVENDHDSYTTWLYDIVLDSYTRGTFKIPSEIENHWIRFIKSEGKLYLIYIAMASHYKIYTADIALLNWTSNFSYSECVIDLWLKTKVIYKGCIYYPKDASQIYEFNLKNFKSKLVTELNKRCAGENIKISQDNYFTILEYLKSRK